MPINKSLMKNLEKNYGGKKGQSVYFAMENSGGKTGKTFKKGVATASKEGHTAKDFKSYKKGKGKATTPGPIGKAVKKATTKKKKARAPKDI